MNKIARIGIACFLGVFFGILIAQEVAHILWWIGALSGGLIGGTAYALTNPYKLMSSIKQAARDVALQHLGRLFSWRPNRTWWKAQLVLYVTDSIACACIVSTFLNFFIYFLLLCGSDMQLSLNIFLTIILGSIAAGFFIGLINFGDESPGSLEACKGAIKYLNPISAHVWAAIGLWRIASYVCRNFSAICSVAFLFTKKFLFYLHSDELALCAFDSIICTVVFFLCGSSPLVGGLLGCLVGIIDYRLISVKWLKLCRP